MSSSQNKRPYSYSDNEASAELDAPGMAARISGRKARRIKADQEAKRLHSPDNKNELVQHATRLVVTGSAFSRMLRKLHDSQKKESARYDFDLAKELVEIDEDDKVIRLLVEFGEYDELFKLGLGLKGGSFVNDKKVADLGREEFVKQAKALAECLEASVRRMASIGDTHFLKLHRIYIEKADNGFSSFTLPWSKYEKVADLEKALQLRLLARVLGAYLYIAHLATSESEIKTNFGDEIVSDLAVSRDDDQK
jgi:hypothetical protein